MKPDERYIRQLAFAPIGPEGQKRLERAAAVIVGCGALGSTSAELLCRAGIGGLKLIDRDFVEFSNLHRQALFDSDDARQFLPKAEAARRKLARINENVRLEAVVADFVPKNALSLLRTADVIIDATDNVESRYLINDAAIELSIPWIYGGAVASRGMVMTIVPGRTACLRCLFLEPPPPGSLATCETEGIIGPTPHAVASLQAAQAMRLIVEGPPEKALLTYLDVWERNFRTLIIERSSDCPTCVKGELSFLRAGAHSETAALCGSDAVQIYPPPGISLALPDLARRLTPLGSVTQNDFLLRFETSECQLNVFPDGRAIVKGTTDPARARTLYARYIGC